MEAARLWRLMDRIPDRVPRRQSGVAFAAGARSRAHPERLALLADFLHWLAPLYPTTRDDQTRLGLFAHRPAHADEDETLALEEETLV